MRAAVAIAFALGVVQSGCGADTIVEPEPSPTPVMGVANARVFDNMALIRSLERKDRATTILTAIGADATLDGVVQEGAYWAYIFTDFQRHLFYIWQVSFDGEVGGPSVVHGTRLPFGDDIGALITLDSDEAVEITLASGAKAFVDRYPNINVRIGYEIQAGLPVCHLIFEDLSGTSGTCAPRYWIHATTKELLARDAECIHQ
jgi:hypothetical protein